MVAAEYQEGSVDAEAEKDCRRVMHKTIRKATEDMERFRFNTMLAALMEYTNELGRIIETGSVSADIWQEAIRNLLILLAPSAPHMTEELWSGLGYEYSVHNQAWPAWDSKLATDDEVTLVVQINGKVRDKLMVPAQITEDEAKKLAFGEERIKGHIAGKDIVKIIYVPGKLLNIVIK